MSDRYHEALEHAAALLDEARRLAHHDELYRAEYALDAAIDSINRARRVGWALRDPARRERK